MGVHRVREGDGVVTQPAAHAEHVVPVGEPLAAAGVPQVVEADAAVRLGRQRYGGHGGDEDVLVEAARAPCRSRGQLRASFRKETPGHE